MRFFPDGVRVVAWPAFVAVRIRLGALVGFSSVVCVVALWWSGFVPPIVFFLPLPLRSSFLHTLWFVGNKWTVCVLAPVESSAFCPFGVSPFYVCDPLLRWVTAMVRCLGCREVTVACFAFLGFRPLSVSFGVAGLLFLLRSWVVALVCFLSLLCCVCVLLGVCWFLVGAALFVAFLAGVALFWVSR